MRICVVKKSTAKTRIDFKYNITTDAFVYGAQAEDFEKSLDTGDVDTMSTLVAEDFVFYCDWPGCPLTLENFQNFLSPGFSFSTWFNISYDEIRFHTEVCISR